MITSLYLQNYRNFSSVSISSKNEKLIFIHGKNGAGKTSILESISLLYPGKGFRNEEVSNVIKNNFQEANITIDIFSTVNFQTKTNISLNNKKEIYINETKSRISEISKLITIITLTPQMSDFFTGPSITRRNWLDRIAYSNDVRHAKLMKEHDKYLKERLNILESCETSSILDIIEMKIEELSINILNNRLNAIHFINSNLSNLKHFNLPAGQILETGEIYKNITFEKKISLQLKNNRNIDKYKMQTTFSLHKTDFILYINDGQNIRTCSTGEQRLGLIALTLCCANEKSVLLLDELFCHLDLKHKELLSSYIEKIPGQIWISSVEKQDSIFMSKPLLIKL